MDGDFMDEEVLLRRYALVGGPDDMIPRLRRVAQAVRGDRAVAEEARREAFVSERFGRLAAFRLTAIVFGVAVPLFLPETKGRTLEEIERYFAGRGGERGGDDV